MTLASMARKYERRSVPTGDRVATSAMIASLAAQGYDTVAAPFGHALLAAAKKDDRIVGLTADLAKDTDLHVFAQAMPAWAVLHVRRSSRSTPRRSWPRRAGAAGWW